MFRSRRARKKRQAAFVDALNLNPFSREKQYYDDDKVFGMLQKYTDIASKEYVFLDHTDKIHPVIMAKLLGASERVVEKMLQDDPDVKVKSIVAAVILDDQAAMKSFVERHGTTACRKARLSQCNLLHLACFSRSSPEIIEYLIRKVPKEWLGRKGAFGCTPLMFACKSSSQLETIRMLVQHHVTAVGICDEKNVSPLQSLWYSSAPKLDVVIFLLEKWPQALLTSDREYGNGPLHVACRNDAPLEIIKVLVSGCPRDITRPNLSHQTPLVLAREGRCSNDTITYLSFASFFQLLMEDDQRNIQFKIDELIPLLCDVHAIKLFYSLVSFCCRLGAITSKEKANFINRGLRVVQKYINLSDESRRQFGMVLLKAKDDSIITSEQQDSLHYLPAQIESDSYFDSNLYSHVLSNAINLETKTAEASIDYLREKLNSLSIPTRSNRTSESPLTFMLIILRSISFGCIEDNKEFVSSIVDFSDYDHIDETLHKLNCGDDAYHSFLSGSHFSSEGNSNLQMYELSYDLFFGIGYYLAVLDTIFSSCTQLPGGSSVDDENKILGTEQKGQKSLMERLDSMEIELSIGGTSSCSIQNRVSSILCELGMELETDTHLLKQVKDCEVSLFGKENKQDLTEITENESLVLNINDDNSVSFSSSSSASASDDSGTSEDIADNFLRSLHLEEYATISNSNFLASDSN